ncbi:Dot/Icm T4SS effector Ceg17 [Legionella cardiaca]|uniref:Uncharacterized protein n=1 Tax=Legionella cardiaca TaxID=1071983 RepID=A0ABY8AS68_9GAMM|nr:Dot/Icm T4SS effector Ceg17 [Legionella cardiaca]WED43373.1 hypothetical protein PXX05_00945 [Legionella cardiaca]
MKSMASIYEQIQEDKKSYQGITLSYQGAHYGEANFDKSGYIDFNSDLSPLEAFTERFKNIGALVIRFHLGQGQRAGLLQQVAKFDYSNNPVERPAHGNDEVDMFFDGSDVMSSKAVGQALEFASHLPLGRSKLLNERAQPLVHVNKQMTYGEQALWDIIHAPVWNVGRNMRYELTKQGFIYLACPSTVSPVDRRVIDKELRESGKPVDVVFSKFDLKPEISQISKLGFYMDDKQEYTSESNGLAISTPEYEKFAPLGWIIHAQTGEVLPQEITEDIIRVTAISEGGFYEKRSTQQKILQAGNLVNSSGLGLFIQNQAFNAMYVIFDYLQKYNFDPRPLLSSSLSIAYSRMQKAIKEDPSCVDDFLVGALQDEMVQPLRVSQPRSKRTVLPIRFTNNFEVTYNNLKAIAYAFDMKDSASQPIFRAFDEGEIIKSHGDFIDAKVNGYLVSPSFNTSSHVAAVLSTALLVAEEMILEQLLPEALHSKDKSHLFNLLSELLDKEAAQRIINELTVVTESFPKEDGKVITGTQFDYCEPVLQILRKNLGLNKLPELICHLAKPGVSTEEAISHCTPKEVEQLTHGLKILYGIGLKLQESPLTSAESAGSRGINAGLQPLIAHLDPLLAKSLGIPTDTIVRAEVKPVDKEKAKSRISTQAISKCPFFAPKASVKTQRTSTSELEIAHKTAASAVPVQDEKRGDEPKYQPSFFTKLWNHKQEIGIAVTGAVCLAAGLIISSQS